MKFFLSSILGIFTYIFGNLDSMLFSVLLLFGIDFLLALFVDFKQNKFEKKDLILRIFKIFGYLSLIAISVILDKFLTIGDSIRYITLISILYYSIANIFSSCLTLGLKVPTFLLSSLQHLLDSMPKEKVLPSDIEKKSLSS